MRKSVLLLGVALCLPACRHSGLVGGGPVLPPADVPNGSVRYYVGKDLVVVTGSVKHTWDAFVEAGKDITEPEASILFRETTTWVGKVDLQTVADTSKAYWVRFQPGG